MQINLSRRRFFASATVLAAASALPGRALSLRNGPEVFTNASTAGYLQGLLTRQHLETLIGTLFMAFLDGNRVAYMRLVAVESFKTKSKRTSAASFHLSFDTGGVELVQDSYLLDHGRLGRFAMLLTPGTGANGAPTCGAVVASADKQ